MRREAQEKRIADPASMEVYLLPGRRGRYRLFSRHLHELDLGSQEEDPEPQAENGQKPGVLRRVAEAVRRATRPRAAREKLLREFRHPDRLQVYFPASLEAEEAQSVYRQVLESQVRKHRRWLLVNGALLPVGVVFGLVPGPNVWLAYLAWRTLAHHRTRRGGERALSDLDVTFLPEAGLDPLVLLMRKRFVRHRKARIREIGEHLGITDLDRFYY